MDIETTKEFIRKVHDGVLDKCGVPYHTHPERVSDAVFDKMSAYPENTFTEQDFEDAQNAALLHDVVEDTDETIETLRDSGFNDRVLWLVDNLTKKDNTKYQQWIEYIINKNDLILMLIKLSDNEDNSDPARLICMDETNRARMENKYSNSKAILIDAIRNFN